MLAAAFGAGALFLICAGLLAPLESLFPKTGVRRDPKAIALCFGLLAVNTVAMRAVGSPVLSWIAGVTPAIDAPSPARIAAALLLGDLLGYWLHRAMHRVPLLWKLHRVHHADVELSFVE